MASNKNSKHIQMQAHFAFSWIAVVAILTSCSTAMAAEPSKRAAIVIQREYLQDRGLKREIDRYIELVQMAINQ